MCEDRCWRSEMGSKLWQLVKILRGKWDFRPIYDHHLYVRGHFGGLLIHTRPDTQMSNIPIFTYRVIDCTGGANMLNADPTNLLLFHKNWLICQQIFHFALFYSKWGTDNEPCSHLFILKNSHAKYNKYLSQSRLRICSWVRINDLIGHWFPVITMRIALGNHN